jgi:hypothetical protein
VALVSIRRAKSPVRPFRGSDFPDVLARPFELASEREATTTRTHLFEEGRDDVLCAPVRFPGNDDLALLRLIISRQRSIILLVAETAMTMIATWAEITAGQMREKAGSMYF